MTDGINYSELAREIEYARRQADDARLIGEVMDGHQFKDFISKIPVEQAAAVKAVLLSVIIEGYMRGL